MLVSFEGYPTAQKAFTDEQSLPITPELYIYSRYRNPTVVAAEEYMASIEGSQWSLLCQSGMAAIDIALSVFQRANHKCKWAFFSEIYGGTNSYIDSILVSRRGVDAVRFSPHGEVYSTVEFDSFMAAHKPDVVFFEVISNPMLIVADAAEIIRIAKKYGAAVIIDNTFATPYLFKPLDFGADLVIHSATKYLSGHGNLSAGVVSGNSPELAKAAIEYLKLVGHMLSPDDAYRLHDMLKTFNLRINRHFENAATVAKFLSASSKVEKVIFPGLNFHPSHEVASSLFGDRGFGGIVTFDLKGSTFNEKQKNCNQFINAVSSHIPLIPTLGDADTILMPVEPVWGDKYPFPGMIRLSIGIENSDNIIEVISKGLDAIRD
jgi:cystathionine beta-lyase/cystathionine gamma-synthase